MKKMYKPGQGPMDKRSHDDDEDDDDDMFMGFGGNKMLDKFTPTIYVSGVMTDKTAKDFRDAVRELEYVRKSDIALIVINSPGGHVDALFQMLNTMKGANIEFMTYCISNAYSCAAVLLSAGAEGKRFMAPLSDAMVHEISGGAIGSMPELRTTIKNMEAHNKMLMGEFARNCGKTLAQVQADIHATGSTDLFFSPHEAVKYGFVDVVGCVNLAQARAYQLEVVSEEEPEEEISLPAPEEITPAKKAPAKKTPAKKAPAKKAPTKKPVKK